MSSMSVRAAVAILLLFIATVDAGDGYVSFWRSTFEMTCPGDGIWYNKDNKNISDGAKTKIQIQYENANKGLYRCEYEDQENKKINYYFYVQGKVCENCFELNSVLFAGVIFGDIIFTAVVMLIIYKCTKKKGPVEVAHTSKPPARSGGRAQPTSPTEYEQLNAHTRSKDTYSVVNRMG